MSPARGCLVIGAVVAAIVLLGVAIVLVPGGFCDSVRSIIGIGRCNVVRASAGSSDSTKLPSKYDAEPSAIPTTLLKSRDPTGVTAPSADKYIYDAETTNAVKDVETSTSPELLPNSTSEACDGP